MCVATKRYAVDEYVLFDIIGTASKSVVGRAFGVMEEHAQLRACDECVGLMGGACRPLEQILAARCASR